MFQFKSKTFETELTLCDKEVELALANEQSPDKENTAIVDSENRTTEVVLEGKKEIILLMVQSPQIRFNST